VIIAFDFDNGGFACSRSMEISNLSLSQSNECHHPGSPIGKKGANCCQVFEEELTTLYCKWKYGFFLSVFSFGDAGSGPDGRTD
jgi:hypothetical protein